MMTGAQLRGARGLLGMSQEVLAERSGISQSTIKRLEAERSINVREASVHQLASTLEAAGIEFVTGDAGQGVLLRPEAIRQTPVHHGASRLHA